MSEASGKRLLFERDRFVAIGFIVIVGQSNDAAVFVGGTEIGSGLLRRGTQNGSPFVTTFAANNDRRSARQRRETPRRELAQNACRSISDNVRLIDDRCIHLAFCAEALTGRENIHAKLFDARDAPNGTHVAID